MIKIGVSACLLGQNVRYDGKNKFTNLKNHFDSGTYELIPICPEVEMGMGIPRPPIQILSGDQIKLVQVDNHGIDYTQQMKFWFDRNRKKISDFSGFILKSKSPSCGNKTTAHLKQNNKIEFKDGLFVSLIKSSTEINAFIDETQLNEKAISSWVKRLK